MFTCHHLISLRLTLKCPTEVFMLIIFWIIRLPVFVIVCIDSSVGRSVFRGTVQTGDFCNSHLSSVVATESLVKLVPKNKILPSWLTSKSCFSSWDGLKVDWALIPKLSVDRKRNGRITKQRLCLETAFGKNAQLLTQSTLFLQSIVHCKKNIWITSGPPCEQMVFHNPNANENIKKLSIAGPSFIKNCKGHLKKLPLIIDGSLISCFVDCCCWWLSFEQPRKFWISMYSAVKLVKFCWRKSSTTLYESNQTWSSVRL